LITPEPSSFRDNAGFMFRQDGVLFRQICEPYRPHWEHLAASGLMHELQDRRLLVRHKELPVPEGMNSKAIALIRPEVVPFISYPYEWCFSELKDAALCTLQIQRKSLE
jgi:hypothetical protein